MNFERAKEIWEGPVLEAQSSQTHHGEERVIAIGHYEGRLLAVVFMWREGKRRIIFAPDRTRARLVIPQREESVHLRVDPDVLEWFRQQGKRPPHAHECLAESLL